MGTRPRGGDEGGADVIALGQGGQALDVDSEEAAEGVGLRLAQLGELRSDVLDRAVALAQLEADDDVVADRAGAGSVALGAKGVDERRGPCGRVVAGTVDLGGAALLECADPLVGEGTHRLVARGLAHEAHGVGRQRSRTDTLKHWHSLKKAEKDTYRHQFPELLNRQGDFDSSILQEFDFAYKDSAALLATQPHLLRCDETRPVATVKFMGM